MSCFDELTYVQFVDGELPAGEGRGVEAHIASCAGCRALVEALRAESALLSEVLLEDAPEAQGVPVVAAARRAHALDILWTAAVVLAAAVGLQGVVSLVSGFEAPAGTNWLNPFSLSVQLRVFFDSVFYFTEEGVGMLTSTLAAVSGLVLVLLLGVATLIYARRRPRVVALLATLAFGLLLAVPSGAIERRKGGTVRVAANETLDDSLVAFGETVLIEGVITGNLIAFAHRVSITGTVQGDAIMGGQRLEVKGKVGGNVIAFGEQVWVEGEVGQSVITCAQALAIEAEGRVKGDVLVFAGELNLDGAVERDVTAATGQTYVRGHIGRNLALQCDRATLLDTARIGGNVTARVKRENRMRVDAGAVIGGELKTLLPKPKRSRFTRPRFYFWQGVSLVGAFLTGLLLYWLFPALFAARLETTGRTLLSAGVGLLLLVGIPLAALLVGVTVVGLPIALLSLAVYLFSVYLAKIFVGVLLGCALMQEKPVGTATFALALVLGLLIIYIVGNLPFVGWFVSLVVWCWGLGIVAMQARQLWLASEARAAAGAA